VYEPPIVTLQLLLGSSILNFGFIPLKLQPQPLYQGYSLFWDLTMRRLATGYRRFGQPSVPFSRDQNAWPSDVGPLVCPRSQ